MCKGIDDKVCLMQGNIKPLDLVAPGSNPSCHGLSHSIKSDDDETEVQSNWK